MIQKINHPKSIEWYSSENTLCFVHVHGHEKKSETRGSKNVNLNK